MRRILRRIQRLLCELSFLKYPDLETLLPYGVAAIIGAAHYANDPRSAQSLFSPANPFFWICVFCFGLGVPHIMVRTFDRPKEERLWYFAINQVALALVVFGILALSLVVAPRTP